MENLIYFFMALGLSMDAFSLSIAYGTNNINKIKVIILSTLVGIFHFFMPYIGSVIGGKIFFLIENTNYIISTVFFLLSFEMYKSRNEEHNATLTNIISLIIFAFTVSIDSFSVGLVLGINKNKLITAFHIFSIVSAIFTYVGLTLGKYLSIKYGKKANYFGIVILLGIGIKYLVS